MILQWSVFLAVGVSTIDNQHIELFNRFNNLLDALEQGDVNEELADIVKFLDGYVVTHFAMEEEVMDRYSYAVASVHKAQHSDFVAQFESMKKLIAIAGFNRPIAIDMLKRLGDWLVNHVGDSDRQLGSYLRVAMMLRKAA